MRGLCTASEQRVEPTRLDEEIEESLKALVFWSKEP